MNSTTNALADSQPSILTLLSNNYGPLQVIIVVLSVFLYLLISKRINRFSYLLRKRWHTVARGVTILIFVLSFLPYFFVSTANSAESLALASIIVTLFASLIPTLYAPFDNQIKIHVAIPSLRPFNMAIRSGLYQKLSDSNHKYVISDDHSSIRNSAENHARLNDLTYDAVRDCADFLIVHPATETAANDSAFTRNISKLLRNGCYVFCIENFPDDSSALYLSDGQHGTGRLVRVQSDSHAGASVLASFVKNEHATSFSERSAKVILMSGPIESRNAKIRHNVLHDAFSDAPSIAETPRLWWGVSSGRRAMFNLICDLQHCDPPKNIIILAANDDMALGACSAITTCDAPLPPIKLYGYDGILPARYAIGQNTTPFAATVHIEPEDYGKRICELLLSVADGDYDIEDILIPVSASKIKDEARCNEELGLV